MATATSKEQIKPQERITKEMTGWLWVLEIQQYAHVFTNTKKHFNAYLQIDIHIHIVINKHTFRIREAE